MKTRIINLFKQNENKMITGPDIAKELNITRSYVSKAVKELKEEGYNIEQIDRSGYIYHDDIQVLNCDKIINNLVKPTKYKIDILDKVDSTNNYLKEHGIREKNIYHIAVANEQTGGFGRMARSFVSNKGKGIYMSLGFIPNFSLDISKKLTACISVGVARAIDKLYGTNTKIKWVNDIYLNDLKICGIITLGTTNLELGMLDYAIIGIGINMYHQAFPDELKNKVTTLYDETHIMGDRSILIAEVLNEVSKLIETIETNDFIKEYRDRSNLIGRIVELSYFTHTDIVKVVDINDEGELVIEKDGEKKTVYSGEVQRMRLNYE